jgi:hypothetical protein
VLLTEPMCLRLAASRSKAKPPALEETAEMSPALSTHESVQPPNEGKIDRWPGWSICDISEHLSP